MCAKTNRSWARRLLTPSPKAPGLHQECFQNKMAACVAFHRSSALCRAFHLSIHSALCCVFFLSMHAVSSSSPSTTRWLPASCANGLANVYLSSEYIQTQVRTRGIPLLLARSATCFSTHRINAWTPAKSRATTVQAHLVLGEGPAVCALLPTESIV